MLEKTWGGHAFDCLRLINYIIQICPPPFGPSRNPSPQVQMGVTNPNQLTQNMIPMARNG
jgi:hypothetical protein